MKDLLKIIENKKYLFFDLDDTLVMTGKFHKLAYDEALKKISNHKSLYEIKKETYINIIKNNDIEKRKVLFQLIDNAKNQKICIVTNTTRENAELILNKISLKYDLLITGTDYPTMLKPKPGLYLKAIEHFNCDRCDCIIFEDSDKGIKAGKLSNIDTYDVINKELHKATGYQE